MANTHDYVISNDTGANVRADLNVLFGEAESSNAGTSSPTNVATGDYMTISSETKDGFGINFYNSSAVSQTRTYNYIARGV